MTDLVVSDSLKDRRRTLKNQRQLKVWQSLWRFSVLCSAVGGLVWLMSWPEWSIRDRTQVQLKGNQWVSSDQLYKQVPLVYPQSIWQLSTQQISQKMSTIPSLEKVDVTRQLLPAQLTITVRERRPVALAVTTEGPGFVDREGIFIPAASYEKTAIQVKLPKSPLFLGYDPQYQTFWKNLYPLLDQSSVKIDIINGRNPSNLTMKTDLGMVYLGSNLSQFPQQLQVLNLMKQLPSRVPPHRVAYIDLTQPKAPSVQITMPSPKQSPASNVKKP